MSRLLNWRFYIGILLLVLSIAFYFLHYLIFRDPHHIFIYMVGDVAFVFIEVLLVTLIIHHLLGEWEKRSKLKKLNMVIETFFSEFGKLLLAYLSSADTSLKKIRDAVIMDRAGSEPDFKAAHQAVERYHGNLDLEKIDLEQLELFLREHRHFLVDLLQNPNLLEHENFTRSLMATFHITEELAARDLADISEEDRSHLKNDLERAYGYLIRQWVSYMEYTHENYPYFYVFAMRTNPFDAEAPWLESWTRAHGDALSRETVAAASAKVS
ncbi:MAG: hypothetical protein R6U50_01580 [Desulfobacterales bacterium]